MNFTISIFGGNEIDYVIEKKYRLLIRVKHLPMTDNNMAANMILTQTHGKDREQLEPYHDNSL